MFDLGLSEIILILLALIIFVKPEDLPEILRFCGKMVGRIKAYISDITDLINNDESLNTRQLKADDGNYYPAYDVKKAFKEVDKKPTELERQNLSSSDNG